jgi:hypothetical protein
MKWTGVLLLHLFLFGCIQNSANQLKKSTTTLKNAAGSSTKLLGNSVSAIGSNSNTSVPVVMAPSDNVIEFKGTPNGNMVCSYPSNVCKTDADEHSGGASYRGTIPNSANSFIHYMKFKFYSDGYFANNPGGHIAIGLRGIALRDEDVGAANAGANGRGMIFGHIESSFSYNKSNPACVDRMVEVETWYRTAYNEKRANDSGNIIPSTCSDTIFEDYKWYSAELEVTTTQYIIVKIYNSDNQLIYKTYYNDQPNYLDPNLTGWFIGHVFQSAGKTWSVRFENFEVGHVLDTDIFYPVKDFSPTISFSTRLGEVNNQNGNDFSIVLDKSLSSQIAVNNIVNRTRIWGCTSLRSSKSAADSVDCNNSANYKIMNLSAEADWVYSNNTFSLKESFVKSLPAGFYSQYFRLNPQDITNQISLSFELRDSGATATPAATARQFFCDGSNNMIYFICGARPDSSWHDAGGGCFHKAADAKCGTTPVVVPAPIAAPVVPATIVAPQSFCTSSHTRTYYVCGVPQPDTSWHDAGGGCFHKGSADFCN